MEKYGFVYIWYDRKHKRYYIGCHWGTEDDGYICSSPWMNRSYKKRPQDFRRKILVSNIKERMFLLDEENRYLSQIKKEELGKKYYNLTNYMRGHWSMDNEKVLSVPKKISLSKKGKKHSEETKRKIGLGNKNKIVSEETRRKIGLGNKGKTITIETKEKLRLASTGKPGWNKGKTGIYSEETLKKMRESAKNRSKK